MLSLIFSQATEEISQAESEISQWLEEGGGESTGENQVHLFIYVS